MKKLFIILISFCFIANSYAQIGINATNTPPDASAMLDVSSTTKGVLIPRMTTIQKNNLPNKSDGLLVYDTDLKVFSYYKHYGGPLLGFWQDFGNPPATPPSVWNTNGNDINSSNIGNVGIGTSVPNAKLEIQADATDGLKIVQSGPHKGVEIQGGTTNNTYPVLEIFNSTSGYGGYFRAYNATARGLYSLLEDNGNSHDAIEGLTFGTGRGGYFSSSLGAALVTGTGNVGIGNDSPSNKLSVTGNADFSGNVGIGNSLPTNKLSVTGNADIMGNVGIGTPTPDAKLQVNGTFKLLDGSQGLNKVLTSDANGLASWQNSAAGSNYWTLTGGNLTSASTSVELQGGTNIGALNSGFGSDGTLIIDSPYASIFSQPYLTLDGSSIQARTYLLSGSRSNQNLKLNPFGGKVGIGTGTTTINSTLFVIKSANSGDGTAVFKGTTHFTHFHYGANEDTYIRGGKDNANVIINDIPGGKVGIGVVPTLYTLEVNGTTRSKELIVETGWADYVFEEKYKLKSIEELEVFVKENKHLPNIPSAAEIESKGLKVGETNKVMMEKIEELALYIIQLKKEIDLLKTKN
jgi:hypothetical protein